MLHDEGNVSFSITHNQARALNRDSISSTKVSRDGKHTDPMWPPAPPPIDLAGLQDKHGDPKILVSRFVSSRSFFIR